VFERSLGTLHTRHQDFRLQLHFVIPLIRQLRMRTTGRYGCTEICMPRFKAALDFDVRQPRETPRYLAINMLNSQQLEELARLVDAQGGEDHTHRRCEGVFHVARYTRNRPLTYRLTRDN